MEVMYVEHDCFRFMCDEGVVYTDPFKVRGEPRDADYVFITHEHYDHCSLEDLQKVITPETIIVATPDCTSKLARLRFKQLITVEPGRDYAADRIRFATVPAYNVNKWKSPGVAFHPREDGRVGYIIHLCKKRVYHAGDTDHVPEMYALTDIDLALLPVSGTYVMTAEEAAKAADAFKPARAIPMHYGAIVGDESDALRFKSLASVPVLVLEKQQP